MMSESNDASILWHRAPESDPDADQLLHPSGFYGRPADVVADEELTIEERRAILSSWASDACAVESHPLLRQPPCSSEPVTFEEIMDALAELDRIDRNRQRDQHKGHCRSNRACAVASQRMVRTMHVRG